MMASIQQDSTLALVVPILVKASALVALAALAHVTLLRRSSAASRHFFWTLTVAGLVALPALSFVVPSWALQMQTRAQTAMDRPAPVPVMEMSARAAAPPMTAIPDPAPAVPVDAQMSWITIAWAVHVGGVAILLIHLLMQQWSVRRLTREAATVGEDAWARLLADCSSILGVRRPVRLLRSHRRSMPMTVGTWPPAIVIPAIADTWSDDRKRAVLLHELAHVARFDCLTQMLAFVACALYWFHPGAWYVARRLRVERELACDDLVLGAGAPAREYAGHLLEIAYAVGHYRAPALAVSMARPRQLEGRMLAVLDGARNRRRPAPRARVVATAGAGVLLIVLASLTVVAVAADAAVEPGPPIEPTVPADAQTASATKAAAPLQEMVRESGRRIAQAARAAYERVQDKYVAGPGSWELRRSKTDGTVNLQMRHGTSSSGFNVPAGRLEGLTDAHLTGAGGSVQFRLRRDAGTFNFEGVVRNGVGGGTYTFAPDASFPGALEKRGFARPTEAQQFEMARSDVGFELIDELPRQGYGKPELAELIRAGQHGVTAAYVREMADAGYKLGTLPPLVTLRDHGVTPTYVRELAALGYKGLPADEIRRARDHGVTAEFVRELAGAGHGRLSLEQVIRTRDHGVTPEFIRMLGEAGHKDLALEEVVRVRDHGVTPEYVREMRALGHGASMSELVRARDHGVNPEFARRMADLGYPRVSLDMLIRARDHGVTAAFVDELKKLGYEKVPLEDLIHLRDHGFTAERIRTINSRAGTRLPLDVLRSIR